MTNYKKSTSISLSPTSSSFDKHSNQGEDTVEKIKKWITVQKSASASIMTLVNHAILRFGPTNVMHIDAQFEISKDSPFLEVFQASFSDYLNFDGSEITTDLPKLFRTSFLGKRTSKEDELRYNSWFDAQSNLSASVRSLIIESIKISGFVDIMSPLVHQGLTLLHTFTKASRLSPQSPDHFMPFVVASFNALVGDETFAPIEEDASNYSPSDSKVDPLLDSSEEIGATAEEDKVDLPDNIEKPKPATEKVQNNTNSNEIENEINTDGFF